MDMGEGGGRGNQKGRFVDFVGASSGQAAGTASGVRNARHEMRKIQGHYPRPAFKATSCLVFDHPASLVCRVRLWGIGALGLWRQSPVY